MKRLALAAGLLVVTAMAATATFLLPAWQSLRAKPAEIAALAPTGAPAVSESARPPIPFVRAPRPSASERAALAAPPPTIAQEAAEPQRLALISVGAATEWDASKFVRDVNSSCAGRSLIRITIARNGDVRATC